MAFVLFGPTSPPALNSITVKQCYRCHYWLGFTICSFFINLCSSVLWLHFLTCTHTYTYTQVLWPRQALRPTWLFYHLLPQKCFSSSFPPWKTEFMTCHLFCWLHKTIRCLGKRFPGYFSCLTKHSMTQMASKVCNSICQWILLCGTDSYSYVLIAGISRRAGCQLNSF